MLLDAAPQAATGPAQVLRFRGSCATADSAAEREAASAPVDQQRRLRQAAAAADAAQERGEHWAESDAWRRYALIEAAPRDPQDPLDEGVSSSKVAIASGYSDERFAPPCATHLTTQETGVQ